MDVCVPFILNQAFRSPCLFFFFDGIHFGPKLFVFDFDDTKKNRKFESSRVFHLPKSCVRNRPHRRRTQAGLGAAERVLRLLGAEADLVHDSVAIGNPGQCCHGLQHADQTRFQARAIAAEARTNSRRGPAGRARPHEQEATEDAHRTIVEDAESARAGIIIEHAGWVGHARVRERCSLRKIAQ